MLLQRRAFADIPEDHGEFEFSALGSKMMGYELVDASELKPTCSTKQQTSSAARCIVS